jgi:arylsulfatase A-like enzyme
LDHGLAGVSKREHVIFTSLPPRLRSVEALPPYAEIYRAYIDQQRAIVHGGYKLISYLRVNVTRLYDLAQDPDEARDLANDTAHRPIRDDLEQRLRRLQQRMNDPLAR